MHVTKIGMCALVALAMIPRPVAAQAAAAPDPAVEVAQRFLDLLKQSDWPAAGAMVIPAAQAQLGAPQLGIIWGQVRSGLGELQTTELHQVVERDSLRTVELAGTFTAQRMLVRVVVTPGGQVSGFFIAPMPAPSATAADSPPYADAAKYTEHEVTVGADPWELGATLTVPVGAGRHPVVVLVHGSGPHDRDETIGANRPFLDLAHGLATAGVAVLRYEKRTKAHGSRLRADITVDDEVIVDALAALDLVRGHPSIDPARVYVGGHSLGAQMAPEIARRDGRLAGVILLAAPARPIVDVLLDQLAYLATRPQNQAPAAQTQLEAAAAQVRALGAGGLPDTANVLGAPASYWMDVQSRDAIGEARALDIPILVLQGERDYQVTMADFALWQDAMKEKQATSLRSFPALNHLFIAGSGPADPIEYTRAGHVAVEVVQAIAEFVKR